MLQKVIGVVAALGGFALLWKAFTQWGVPALVSIFKDKVSPRVARFIYRTVSHFVDIAEIAGEEFDWKGEEKCLEVLARMAEEIGRQLKPTEAIVAKRAIAEAVRHRNKKADSVTKGLSFADMIKKPRR